MVFTCLDEDLVTIRHYESRDQKDDLVEIGPSIDLKIKRTQLATGEQYKAATKKLKLKE